MQILLLLEMMLVGANVVRSKAEFSKIIVFFVFCFYYGLLDFKDLLYNIVACFFLQSDCKNRQ